MKPATITSLFLLFALVMGATTAQAAEALPQLKGLWLLEAVDGKPPQPKGIKMAMDFVDDVTLRMEVSFEGKSEAEEIKYAAKKDGSIILYSDPDNDPDGEKATWQVKADKKLYLTSADGEVLVFKRPG